MEGLCSPLCVALVPLKALLSVVAAARSGFGLLFGVSFAEGHSVLLETVMLAMHGEKETMSPKELDFKHFHRPHPVSLRGCYP